MKIKIKNYIPQYIQFIFLSLLLLVVINMIFRGALLYLHNDLATGAASADIFYCLFNIGFLFDLYISLIIILLPYILCSFPFIANKKMKPFLLLSNWIIILLAMVNFAVSSTDLGFFSYYNSRITNTIFDWTNDIGLMLKVMSNDSTYLPYFITFIIVIGFYIYLQIKIFKKITSQEVKHYQLKYRLAFFIGFLTLIFFGVRGSINFHNKPLNIDDAFFSENLFLNQLSLNPVYSLAHSYRDVNIEYFKSDNEKVNTTLRYLNREKNKGKNPFEIQVNGSDSIKPNFILIFLESMSNAMVSRYNPKFRTTPLLDSLAEQGIVFDNFFSAGVHTHNAIFTTLYGLPAIMNNKPMNTLVTANMKFHGLPWIMKEKNYQTQFYVTGSKKFDNMNDFLILNGFDKVIGEKDYPTDSIFNNWGVTDKTMFNRVINDCDSLYEANTLFFSSILTISAHEGYLVPNSYDQKLINKEHPYKLYEFSDLLVKEFMSSAKNKDWFKNTVFIFVGDHGHNFLPVYDLNLNYHQVPLIIYAPEFVSHIVYEKPGLQQDIYPTLLGLFDFSYTNNALGVDLFKQQRKYAYFSADNKLGIIDDKHFLIYRGENNISMYDYKNNSVSDIYLENPTEADSMLNYGFSMVQSAKYLIDNKLTDLNGTSKPTE